MQTFEKFSDNAYGFFDELNSMRDSLSAEQLGETLEVFLKAWEDIKSPEPLDIDLRQKYASHLDLSFSQIMYRNTHANILPEECPPERLIVRNAAIITDADLDALDEPFYQDVKNAYDGRIAVFNRSLNSGLLPLDIKNLQEFCSAFCLLSHDQHRIYLHEKPLAALTDYSQRIFAKEPVYLSEDTEELFEGLNHISEDRDILHECTMSTELTRHIIVQAANNRLKSKIKFQ